MGDAVRKEARRLLDLRTGLLGPFDGYQRLANIHERTTIIAPERIAAYCAACAVPWPCDTARTVDETLAP
jgi:hypothetical protein